MTGGASRSRDRLYESVHEPPVRGHRFVRRLARHGAFALLVILVALLVGVAGYHWVAGLGWVDSYLNASMILSGMGPVDTLRTNGAKVFAGSYALVSGLVFIGIIGVLGAPLVQRVVHDLHWDADKPRE